MTGSSHPWHLDKLLNGLMHAPTAGFVLERLSLQLGLIAVAGLIGFWLAWLARPRIARAAERNLPQSWAASVAKVTAAVAAPLFWLGTLWLIALGGELAETRLPLLAAGIELIAAWIVIRLLSFSLRSQFAQVLVSFLVWSVAALNILDLFDLLISHLSSSAVHLGKYRLSALTVVDAILFLGVLLWLTLLLFRFLSRQIMRADSLTPSLRVLFVQLLQVLLPALAVVAGLSAAGVNLTALTVISGAVFLGIGLGLQRLVANLVAGLTLLIGKSVKPGDVIAYKNGFGWVTEMGARYVTLRNFGGAENMVPNDYFLENGVENWSHSDNLIGLSIKVGISYASDLRRAMALAVEAAGAVPRVLKEPEPSCMVSDFADSAVELSVFVSINDPKNGTANVKSDVMLEIWDRFHAAGIEFPFPQRDVRLIRPERK
jgi:small-conductance mechanosensitive channel